MKRWLILFAGMVAIAGLMPDPTYAHGTLSEVAAGFDAMEARQIAQDEPKDRYDDKPAPIAFTSPDGVRGVVMPDGRTVLTGEPTPAKNPACDCPDCRCEACDCGKLKGRKAKLDAAVEDNAFVQGLSVHIDELRARLDKVEAENATLREHHAKHHQEEQARAKAAAARHDAPSLYRSSSGSSYYRQPPSTASRFFRN
jgi:hypothetical protein